MNSVFSTTETERTPKRERGNRVIGTTLFPAQPLRIHRSLTPIEERLSVVPYLRESRCREYFDLGELLVQPLEPSPKKR